MASLITRALDGVFVNTTADEGTADAALYAARIEVNDEGGPTCTVIVEDGPAAAARAVEGSLVQVVTPRMLQPHSSAMFARAVAPTNHFAGVRRMVERLGNVPSAHRYARRRVMVMFDYASLYRLEFRFRSLSAGVRVPDRVQHSHTL